MPIFRHRPLLVEAHRVTEANMESLSKKCKGKITSDSNYPSIIINGSRKFQEAKIGDWIIQHKSGNFDVMTPGKFNEEYVER